MTIVRVRTVFTGWPGAPGLMTHFFARIGSWDAGAAEQASTRVKDALLPLRSEFPSGLTYKIEGIVDEIEQSNGNLLNSFSVPSVTNTGIGSAEQAPHALQVCVSWATDGVVAGRRVRGRTFIGPLAASIVDGDGTPKAGLITKAIAFGDAMRDAGLSDVRHVIWHRPSPGGSDGSHHDVTDHTVRDVFAVLRSRRD